MAKVSLRIYNREIESLIDQGHLDEAIAHCRHILRTFPKHLETYRLAGKSYLEAKRYEDAVDIFNRVLMAVPDDFVSHVGMSIICDDENKLDDSIWHMERAFEAQPSNAAIQSELQRLYGRRDGMEPPKIRMTRGALAHMYVQGELYPQAISEIRAVLAQDPQRSDMQVLLARAFFRAGQKADASDMCAQLLKRYPYCFDANRIMVELLPASERGESTQVYRHRVNELDPYTAFSKESVFRSDEVSDASINLERLEYSGQAVEMEQEWNTSLGIGLSSTAGASEQPDWLKSGIEGLESETPSAASRSRESAPASQGSSDIPEFLREAGWTESSGAAEEPSGMESSTGEGLAQANIPDWLKDQMPSEPAPVKSEPVESVDGTPDWLSGLGGTQSEEPAPSASGEVPDWLSGLDSYQPAETAAQSMSAQVPDWLSGLESSRPAEPQAPVSKDLPDWLDGLGADESSEPAPTSASQDVPDWLRGMDTGQAVSAERKTVPASRDDSTIDGFSTPPAPEAKQPEPIRAEPVIPTQPPASISSLGTSAKEQDDAVAWLEMLAAKHGAKPEELVTDPAARSEKPPEWVEQARAIAESQAAAEPAPSKPEEDETGMWLRDLAESEPQVDASQEELPFAESKTPDWLSELESKPEETEQKETQPTSEEAAVDAEVPEWLSQTIKKGTTQPLTEEALTQQADVPDWLNGMQEETIESEPVQEDVSKWLSDVGEESGKEPAPAQKAGVPEWLSGLESTSVSSIEEQPERQEPHLAENEEPVSAQLASSDLPEWLRSLDQGEPGERQEPAREDLPAWLQGGFEEEEEEPHPAPVAPTDWHRAEHPVREPEPELETLAPAARSTSPLAELQPTPPPPDVRKPAPRPVQKSAQPARVKKTSEPTPITVLTLSNAQNDLNRGDIPAALAQYGKLIKKGRNLEETIRDLRDSLYRYPVEVGIWQTLGDAYMRANRLQDALDAYNKAEELLR
jgi:tetratricopeptide (TPR) repeat protein